MPLPSGGSLVFDYGEAFTVVDVNTGRFTGTTKKLEDTILKNNLEAAVEVVRQLRLRDIGGIIVVDFIDMASQKNRDAVLEVLQRELKKDRSKVYVVEISPLGLVEMTRKNVADGVREIMTCECPTCEGTGRVLSDESLAIDMLRNLRRVARESKSEAFRVELEDGVARALIGAGGTGAATSWSTRPAARSTSRADSTCRATHFEILAEGTLRRDRRAGAALRAGRRAEPADPASRTASSRPTPSSRLSAGYEVQVIGGLPYVGTHAARAHRARDALRRAGARCSTSSRRAPSRPARRGPPPRRRRRGRWTGSPTSSSPSAASASGSTSRVACAARSAARPPSSGASAAVRRRQRRRRSGAARQTAPRRRPAAASGESDGAADGRDERAAHDRGRRGGGQAPPPARRPRSPRPRRQRRQRRAHAWRERRRRGRRQRRAGRAGRGSGGRLRAAAPEPGAARPRQQRRRRTHRQRQRRANGADGASRAASASPQRPQHADRRGARRRPPQRAAGRRDAAAASEDERRKGLISRILGR